MPIEDYEVATPEEIAEMDRESMETHKLWHGLCEYLRKFYFTKERPLLWGKVKKRKDDELPTKEFLDSCKSKREIKVLDFKQVKGYDAMTRIGKFADKNPGIVEVRTDDDWFAGSSVFLIPHENEKKFMGTTVMVVPQCSPDGNLFFLYPHHLDNLIKELQKIQQKEKEKNAEQYKYREELIQEMEDERSTHVDQDTGD
jgi:hypothetical protein